MSVTTKQAMAKIALNKSLCKEYSSNDYARVVYLPNDSEFQIQLYNPKSKSIAAKIFLNGEELSDMIVIRPAERIWLERYLNKERKFKFSTYEIDNTDEAKEITLQNGEVKVQFYDVKPKFQIASTKIEPCWVYYNDVYYNNATNNCDCRIKSCNSSLSNISTSVNDICFSSQNIASCDCDIACLAASLYSTPNTTIETGRVEEGSHSNQKFSYVDLDFQSYPFETEIISILPVSRKPVTSSDLHKRYCSQCGHKISPKHKFCPYCGAKVE